MRTKEEGKALKEFQRHLDDLCLTDEEVAEIDRQSQRRTQPGKPPPQGAQIIGIPGIKELPLG